MNFIKKWLKKWRKKRLINGIVTSIDSPLILPKNIHVDHFALQTSYKKMKEAKTKKVETKTPDEMKEKLKRVFED